MDLEEGLHQLDFSFIDNLGLCMSIQLFQEQTKPPETLTTNQAFRIHSVELLVLINVFVIL